MLFKSFGALVYLICYILPSAKNTVHCQRFLVGLQVLVNYEKEASGILSCIHFQSVIDFQSMECRLLSQPGTRKIKE